MYEFAAFLNDTTDKKKGEILTTTSMIQHPTGFMYLDYGNGSYATVYNEDDEPLYNYHNIGISSGSVNTIISQTQGGKTSLAIAMGMSIIEPYITKMVYDRFIAENTPKKEKVQELEGYPFIEILDTEKTLPLDYVKKLTRYKNKHLKRHIIINPITTDKELIKLLEKHIKYKVEHMSHQIMPMLDIYGNPIRQYPPTVLIIDSMSQVLLEDIDDISKIDKKGGVADIYASATQNTAGARRAKIISALYSQLVNYAKRYNIIIFSINHINKMPGMMGIPVKQVHFLRGGETIGGGEKALYLTSTILRLDVIKRINNVSGSAVNLGDDVTGHIVKASWPKSKSNSRGNTCQLCYTNKGGYDPLLSNLWNSKELGTLPKSGNFFFVKGRPEYKFTFKNYQDVFAEHPELFTLLYDQLRNECEKMLDIPDVAKRKDEKQMDEIRDSIREDYENGAISKSDAMDMDDIFSSLLNE